MLCTWEPSEVSCWYLRAGWHNDGHTPPPSEENPTMCIKGFVLVGLATEHPEVTMLFIFPLS